MKAAPSAPRREYTVNAERVYDAPRERVFAAWTRAEHLAHWFGPRGFTIHSCETEARPGGLFRLCLRSPEGQEYWVRGSFREPAFINGSDPGIENEILAVDVAQVI